MHQKAAPEDLPKALDVEKNLVIMRIKEMNKLKHKNFDIIKQGRKFALIEERNSVYQFLVI